MYGTNKNQENRFKSGGVLIFDIPLVVINITTYLMLNLKVRAKC